MAEALFLLSHRETGKLLLWSAHCPKVRMPLGCEHWRAFRARVPRGRMGALHICTCLAVFLSLAATIKEWLPSPVSLPILPSGQTHPDAGHTCPVPFSFAFPSPSAVCSCILSTPLPCPSPKGFPISLFHGFSHLVSTWLGSACFLTSASASLRHSWPFPSANNR